MEDAAAIQKQNIYAHLKLQKSTWMFHSATGNIFCGLEKNRRKMGKHNIKTSSQRPSWFGAALVPQGLYSLLSYAEKLILNFFKDICRGMSAHLFANSSSTEVGWCNKSNQQQNGMSRRKYTFWCGHDLKRVLHTRHPKNIAELKQFYKEHWWKCPSDRCAGPICNYRKHLLEVIAAKQVSASY